MRDIKTFFKYVIPSVLSFALSGIYTIVDGFFVGNSIGDMRLSAVNIAYPIVAAMMSELCLFFWFPCLLLPFSVLPQQAFMQRKKVPFLIF